MRISVRIAMTAAASLLAAHGASAQVGVGASLTPYAGYLFTGNWYDGPIGTSIETSNSPVVGAQASIPLTKGISLTGTLGYADGDLRIGLPLLGGVNVGSVKTWLYDAAVEVGGLGGRASGLAPFVAGGIGGMSNDIRSAAFTTRATNIAYTAAIGVDVGLSPGFGVRLQAKDWIGQFDSRDAVGFRAKGNTAHNWAVTAGAKISF